MSSVISTTAGQAIIEKNFDKVMGLFVARKSIMPNWISDKDEYISPNEEHIEWKQFVTDAVVYSLFNASSQQSGMRNVEYKDTLWDIKNEFFWLSKNKIMDLAKENNYEELYQDAIKSNERFIFNKLFGEKGIYNFLSDDAKDVLDTATELFVLSLEQRKKMSQEHPEYHLNSFDAGYAQLKLVWKEHFLAEYRVFKKKYKKLEQRLEKLVYVLGYLK